ncbi:MAG TPA: serine protease Do, partial [Verrucomicrobiales bacterium]|nr:serine protease Do [Verrucomicrobiales bacterium]
MGFLNTLHFRNAVTGLALVTGLLVPPSLIGADDVRQTPVVKAVTKALPSVVNIRTETVQEVRDPFAELFSDFWNPYYRQPRQDVRRSLGSGVVIHQDGYIITNDHVVRRATKIRVKFANGR